MKIKTIRLRGFIGIKKGLGVDEVSLDVSNLSGLVALEGANGMGKTTLLENFQPYRMLPSRTGTLKSHCFLKDSCKELAFEFNGDLYRTLIKIDATTTRSDEGYIYKNGSQASEVDSKVSNYDDYIEKLLGSPTLFFSSIFCAQNSRKLSDLRPAELKALFAEFLRLDRYVAWEETAKGAMRICIAAQEGLLKDSETTQTKIKLLGDPRADLKAANSLHSQAEKNIESLNQLINEQGLALEELKKEAIQAEQKQQRIKDHEKMLEQLIEKQQEADTLYHKEHQARFMTLEEYEKELESKKDVLEHKAQIEKAVADRAEIDKELSILNNDRMNVVTTQQQLADERKEVNKQVHEINNRLHKIINDPHLLALQDAAKVTLRAVKDAKDDIDKMEDNQAIVRALTQMDALEKNSAILDDVAPGCPCPPEVCGLITASLQAREDLPKAKSDFDDLRESIKQTLEKRLVWAQKEDSNAIDLLNKHKAALDEISGKLHLELEKIEGKLSEVDTQAAGLVTVNNEITASVNLFKDKLLAVIPIADRLPELVAADDITQGLTKEIKRLNAAIVSYDDAYGNGKAETLRRIDEVQAVIDSIKIDPEIKQRLIDAEARLVVLNNDLRKEDEDRLKFAIKIPVIKKEIEELASLEKELGAIAERNTWVRGQKAEWDYLRLACSKDGMRALEIEAVAPVITQNANDLLSMTFGPNHSVRFETQDPDGKEVLSIIVISTDGSETPLQYLSGGEKVWILKSLRLAQTLISQEKSGRHFQTALMDEEDGALSADNAISFIELYRSFQTMAKMDLCFYITHRPEAVAMADSILRFKPGRISII